MMNKLMTIEREIIMTIIQRSSHGLTIVPMESKLLSERMIWIEGEIDQNTANEFLKQVIILSLENKDKPINLIISSIGGEIGAGLQIYDIMRTSFVPINTFCVGIAYSMGALLFTAGAKRYMVGNNSELMLHEPMLGNRISGSASSIRSVSDSLMKMRDKINLILSEQTGKSIEEIEKATAYDHYFSASECIDFHLADKIINFTQFMEVIS